MADDDGILWLKEKHIKSNLGYSNLPVVANKRNSSYKKHRYELANKPKKNKRVETFHMKNQQRNNGSQNNKRIMSFYKRVLCYRTDLYFHDY